MGQTSHRPWITSRGQANPASHAERLQRDHLGWMPYCGLTGLGSRFVERGSDEDRPDRESNRDSGDQFDRKLPCPSHSLLENQTDLDLVARSRKTRRERRRTERTRELQELPTKAFLTAHPGYAGGHQSPAVSW